MKKRAKIAIGINAIIGIMIGGFLIWASDSYGPMDEAQAALESNENLTIIQTEKLILFTPNITNLETGIIFYPGAKVEPEAYAIMARTIAEAGFLVIIARFPLNLAVLNTNAALSILEDYAEIQKWYIGGHSLGGAMAGKVVYENPSTFQGLILLAAYPAETNNLSTTDLDCLMIYGDLDGVLPVNMEDKLHLMPESTQVEVIEGGNHAYFGYYGEQSGDKNATISREQQHLFTTNLIISYLS